MPYKHHASHRNKFKKVHYKVENWAEYNEALRKQGDITIGISDDVVAQWHPAMFTVPRPTFDLCNNAVY